MARQAKTRGTTSEAEIRALCAEGRNFLQIAALLNLNIQALRNTCSVLGIRSGDYRAGPNHSSQKLAGWVARLEGGDTTADIARDEGSTRQAISAALRRRGLPSSVRAAVKAKHATSQAPTQGA